MSHSPMEQGEIHETDADHFESPYRPEDLELGPDIKPPQAKTKKDKHKHHKRRHSSEKRHKQSGNKGPTERSRERYKEADRDYTKERGRDLDINRDRKLREFHEEDIKRREKSNKERERLEKLEMERHRLERERRRMEQEHRERMYRSEQKPRDIRDRYGRYGTKDRAPEKSELESDRDFRARRMESSRSPFRSNQKEEEPVTEVVEMEEQEPEENMFKEGVVEDISPLEEYHQEVSSEKESSGSSSSDSSSSSPESDSSSEADKDEAKMVSKFDSTSEKGADSEEEQQYNAQGQDKSQSDADSVLSEPPSPLEILPDLPAYFPAIQGCRNVEEFHCLNRIEEGTYGVVYRARDKKTNEIVALKRLKMEKEKEGFPITSLREINTLLKSQHPNIVTVREIVVGSNMDRIYIVMDYVEHDLKSLMESMKDNFMMGEVKCLMKQLLRGVAHLHDNWIVHRDLKTSNLLFSHQGILKIGDFGLAREYGSPLKPYTPVVVTLWYRAPELLLGIKEYSTAIDMWSVGCIMAELITRKPLFPGKSEIDELQRIFKELGTPNEKIWQGVSELKGWKVCTFAQYPYNTLRNRFGARITDKGFDMMNRFLTYNPQRRISAEEAINHEWFQESPLPIDPSMFPTWPAKSEQTRKSSHGNSPKPPSGGKAYSKLLGDDDEKFGAFHLAPAPEKGASALTGFTLKF